MGKDFNESVNILFDKVEDLVSTKTVVGNAIVIGDITILPFIDVSVGAAAGAKESIHAMGGVGAKITPSAVMVIQKDSVQIMQITHHDAISKLIDMAPSITDKLNFGSVFSSRNKDDQDPPNDDDNDTNDTPKDTVKKPQDDMPDDTTKPVSSKPKLQKENDLLSSDKGTTAPTRLAKKFKGFGKSKKSTDSHPTQNELDNPPFPETIVTEKFMPNDDVAPQGS